MHENVSLRRSLWSSSNITLTHLGYIHLGNMFTMNICVFWSGAQGLSRSLWLQTRYTEHWLFTCCCQGGYWSGSGQAVSVTIAGHQRHLVPRAWRCEEQQRGALNQPHSRVCTYTPSTSGGHRAFSLSWGRLWVVSHLSLPLHKYCDEIVIEERDPQAEV